jgi:hypothetical protein
LLNNSLRLFPISALKPLLVKLFADETPLLSVNQLILLKTIDPYKNLSLDVEEDTIFVREESSQQQERSKDELLSDSGITLVPELGNQRQHISQVSN